MKTIEANECKHVIRADTCPSVRVERTCIDRNVAFSRELNKARRGDSIARQVRDLIEYDIECDSGIAPYAMHRTYG